MTDNELKHYGVPGMRWGHRKRIAEVQRERARSKEDRPGDEEHEDYKRTIERKSLKSMSTNDINAVTNRINAEKNFREATKSKFQKTAEEIVGGALKEVAKENIKKFFNHYAGGAVNMVTDMIDRTPVAKLFGTYKGEQSDPNSALSQIGNLFKGKKSDDNNADENKNQTNNNQSDNKNQQKQNTNQTDNKNQQKQNNNQTDNKNDESNGKPAENSSIKLKTREDDVKVADPTVKTAEDRALERSYENWKKANKAEIEEQQRKQEEKRKKEKEELEAEIERRKKLFSPKVKI